MSLLLRRLLVVLGVFILVGGFMGFNYLSGLKAPNEKKPIFNTIKTIDTFHVKNGSIPTKLEVQGQLVAFEKVDIFAEVSGTLVYTSSPFKAGSFFKKGATLIKMDDTETKLSLQSQKSVLYNAISQMMPDLKIDYPESFEQWNKYLENFNVEGAIQPFPEPKNKQEKLFVASRNLHSQYYNILSLEERLSKYEIKTPFSGVITEATINPGTLVRTGQKLGTIMNTSQYELEATVPLKDLKYIKVGNDVIMTSDDIDGQWSGRIKRVNDVLDAGTQTVKVFIGVTGANLREGMYLRGEVQAGTINQAIRLPKDLIINQSSVSILWAKISPMKNSKSQAK